MTLIHMSPEQVTEIRNEGLFGGVFALTDEGAGHGSVRHEIDLDDEQVLDLIRRVDYGLAIEVLRSETHATSEDDLDAIYDAVDADENPEEELWPLLQCEQDGAYAGWEIQRLRGRIAAAAGYLAVKCRDEYGTSYLVLPGASIKATEAA